MPAAEELHQSELVLRNSLLKELPFPVQPHFRFRSPRSLLVPELDIGDIALPTPEINGAASAGSNAEAKWQGFAVVVSIHDVDAIELDSASRYTDLQCPVRILAVTPDLVVVDASIDLGASQIDPATALSVDRKAEYQNK
jgi:hypothetical protein